MLITVMILKENGKLRSNVSTGIIIANQINKQYFLYIKLQNKTTMEALTIHPQNDEQLKSIKSVLKALKIPFHKSPYNPEYLKKIQGSEKHQEGEVILKCEEDIGNYFKDVESDVQD